jgi:hypothetical protein
MASSSLPNVKWPTCAVALLAGLLFSLVASGNTALAAAADVEKTPPKPGKTAEIPPEKLAPRPNPPESKPKEDEKDAKRRQQEARASAPVLPPAPDMACKGEALALCNDAVGRDLHLCLSNHVSELSKICKGTLRPYLTALLRTSCSADAKLLCTGMGPQAALECLLEEQAKTSMPCRSALELWPQSLRKQNAGTTGVAQ